MTSTRDPMAAVCQYTYAFNKGDVKAMAATCADPMSILDGLPPHVWQGRGMSMSGAIAPMRLFPRP